MSNWDWAVRGWQHADLATTWLLGALAYLAVLAAVVWLAYRAWTPLGRWIGHRARSHRIRREHRRAGRDIIDRSIQRAYGADV